MNWKKSLGEHTKVQNHIMNNYVTEAINLKSYNLNDADKIMVMYSKENGLIKGVAKGIKKPKSKLGARMDLLVANTLQLLKGRSIDTIIQAQTVNTFRKTRDDIDKLVYSSYVSELVVNFGEGSENASKDIYELCKRADSKQILAEEGLQFVIDKTHFDVLGVGDYNVKGNEASTVARISYGGRSILFTGDMDAKREREFWVNPKADVLKVAHHGSKSSSTEEFINRVNPKFAVISVGFNNRYGHPNKEVLARLKNAGCQILRTDYLGCVQLTLSSGNFTLERWR